MSIAGGGLAIAVLRGSCSSATFLVAAMLGYLLFNGSASYYWQADSVVRLGRRRQRHRLREPGGLSRQSGAKRSRRPRSGVFVTSLYLSAAVAGYLMGGSRTVRGGETPARFKFRCALSRPPVSRWRCDQLHQLCDGPE